MLSALLAGCGATVQIGPGGSTGSTSTGSGDVRTESGVQDHPGTVSRVEIDSDAGDVVLRPGGDARVEHTFRWTGTKPELTESLDGDVLRITARCPRPQERCETDLTVTVPGTVAARTRLAAGDVQVDGLTGTQDHQTAAGSVRAEDVGSEGADVSARSTAGDVEVRLSRPPRTVDVGSTAGNVRLVLPVGPVYRVDARSTVGEVRVDVARDPGAAISIRARSTAGDVTVTSG